MFAFTFYLASMLLDDAITHAQAQAGAFANRFGGEERVKYLIHIFFTDAAAGIAYAYKYFLFFESSGYFYCPVSCYRFTCIQYKIQKYLLKLVFIGEYSGSLLSYTSVMVMFLNSFCPFISISNCCMVSFTLIMALTGGD